MINELLADSERFDSPSVPGLLKSAPDLEPLVGYINSLYYIPESGRLADQLLVVELTSSEKTVEILPNEGADEECDKRSAEVQELENTLETILRKTKKDIE